MQFIYFIIFALERTQQQQQRNYENIVRYDSESSAFRSAINGEHNKNGMFNVTTLTSDAAPFSSLRRDRPHEATTVRYMCCPHTNRPVYRLNVYVIFELTSSTNSKSPSNFFFLAPATDRTSANVNSNHKHFIFVSFLFLICLFSSVCRTRDFIQTKFFEWVSFVRLNDIATETNNNFWL